MYIENYNDIEKSIISNPENVYNLTRGFYPVNKVSPLWIDVNYNINNSHTERNTTTQQHDVYTFLWTSSPVLILTHPDFLELWSLQSITFETHSPIDIVTLLFCSNVHEDTKLNLMNYANIWVSDLLLVHSMFIILLKLKSYTKINSCSSACQGYSAYKVHGDNYYVINNERNYESYIYSFIAGTFLFVVLCEIVEKSKLDIARSGQK